MINSFRAQKFGCLEDVEVMLTPLHAFVGPNDSGKSTLLRAVRTICQLATGVFQAVHDDVEPFEPWTTEHGPWLSGITTAGGIRWSAYDVEDSPELSDPRSDDWRLFEDIAPSGHNESGTSRIRPGQPRDYDHLAPIERTVLDSFGRSLIVRLDPDHLRADSDLNAAKALADRSEWRGDGLPTMVNALLARGDDSFNKIREQIQGLFPHIQRIGAPGLSSNRLGLEVELKSGEVLHADQLSEGLLYYLAFLVLKEINPFDVLLVEEPENGLHPSRIADVVHVLRALTEAESPTQVLIATHSPLVVNELEPEEVSIVVRPPGAGSRVVPMRETRNFAERSDVYALGELWLSYADGEIEAELVGE